MTHICSPYVTMAHTVSATTTKALYYSNNYISMTHSQLVRHYELYCRNHSYAAKALYYSNYYVSMTYIYSSYATIIHTSQQLLLRPYITAINMSL